MKNYIFQSTLFSLFTLMSFTVSAAPKTIDGYWKSFKRNVVVEVIRTRNGIKTKRTDQTKWYYYEKSSKFRYQDDEGNRFILDGKNLIWKSRKGNRTIKFRKVDELEDNAYQNEERFDARKNKHHKNDYYYDDDEDDYDDYYPRSNRSRDRDYYYRKHHKSNKRYNYQKERRARQLEGVWYNYLTGKKIIIDARGKNIEVRLRGRWSRFHQTRLGRFVNNRGDLIRTMSDGTIKYMTCNSPVPIYFERKYRRHYYRW